MPVPVPAPGFFGHGSGHGQGHVKPVMHLTTIDFVVVAAYFVLAVGVATAFIGKAKRSMLDYFLSHRSMPWWLAGTAMVATTFSADTPLAVTEMVVKNGVAGNWL